jgi:hypothetical protein
MSPEKQRIAIAEACGWQFCPPCPIPGDDPDYQKHKEDAIMCWARPGNHEWQTEQVPDYLTDLNAMHEAEKVLTDGQWQQFEYQLCHRDIVNGHFGKARITMMHATAAQRAEAFLRTIGKWGEEK